MLMHPRRSNPSPPPSVRAPLAIGAGWSPSRTSSQRALRSIYRGGMASLVLLLATFFAMACKSGDTTGTGGADLAAASAPAGDDATSGRSTVIISGLKIFRLGSEPA